ncbi:unnamed protein product [Rotaria sp. Silwood2]|nr:unnamed protein product [Rotaria sp. Silwood2]CAF3216329.1 unnamed protein product [Rotaria sp. Silwood2]CAF4551476.1 unnamed protein product [Rotaria sp. Silwood2]CAF4601354.1 unnamed protein product [Rotaria sp. Silwood2]CAF4725648.1 unnamed protein product [Rotaria sp. Silwood2]
MIDANDNILYCMCTAKLDGEAKRWYEDNISLIQWEQLKSSLLERFTTSDSSSKIFEQLKERKQKLNEKITSYHDAVIKLCREYDSSMSQKMMISWLQNGIKDSLKTQIKRQMKLLPESARTTQAFLKIAKDEQELQEEDSSEQEPHNLPTNYSQRNQEAIVKSYSFTQHDSQRRSCSVCQRINHRTIDCYYKKPYGCYKCGQSDHHIRDCSQGFVLTGTCDGGHSSNKQQNPSTTNYASSTLRTPIYINVQVNNKQHPAIVDTGSAVTIINQQLLKKIYHTEFVYKKKLHKSANCTPINIIGEIQLEVKIQGHKTLIIADVATNLITDLLLGSDWIIQNNVIIDSLQRHITLIDKNRRELATAPFVQPSNLQFSATNRQRKLSKNTQLGHISYQTELNNHLILPVLSEDANYQPTRFKSFIYKRNSTRKSGFCDSLLREKRKVRFTDFTCETERREEQQHHCYVCQEQLLSRNNLQQHLHQKCYPSEASLENDTINILDEQTLNYNDREGAHVRDELSNEIENMSDDDIQQDTMNNQHQQCINHKPLTRSQRQNRKHRAKRYRYEIIRKIYHKFTITDIKKILIFMNIPYVNINVVGSTLFLGIKNAQIQNNVDQTLHNGIFTEKHYYNMRKKLRPDK